MEKEAKALAIDIGGTKIFSAVVNKKGEILGEVKKFKTPKTLVSIKEQLKEIISGTKCDIITIATAGAVNRENTRVIGSTANLVKGYSTIDFQNISNLPVFIENDANCAAWAEHEIGSAKGSSNSITVTLGTGVGGGIIVENKILKGKSGAAGEMHFKMSTKKRRRCTCGAWDCWEIYASGNGLELTSQEILGQKMTSYEIIEGVKNNNEDALKVFERWEEYITMGLCGLANIFDPDCIVLSGSMAAFVDVKKIENAVNSEIVTSPLKILHASAGNYSGLIGAALLGFKKIKNI
jgi:glucokinase